jgi:hypothetical protein
MAYKTYEILIRGRGISAAADDPSLPASASAATITLDGITVNGVDKKMSNLQATELATLTAAVKAGLVDSLDVNTIGAATITKGAGVNAGTGQFSVTGVSCVPGTVAETWTVTVTNATAPATWSVVGGTSGAKASATTGIAYDNGQIAFTINDTGTDAALLDQFTLVVSAV